MLLNYHEVHRRKVLLKSWFKVRNIAKKEQTNIFSIWTKKASSIKVLSLWLYCNFRDSIAHLIYIGEMLGSHKTK